MSTVDDDRVTVQTANAVQVNRERTPLRFGVGNAKLHPGVWTFSLPAGHSCPQSLACRSRADRRTGWVTDGRHTTFRCYAATAEARCPTVRRFRWANFDALRACRTRGEMTRLVLDSLSPFCPVLRVHASGDFFSPEYFAAWLDVARERPNTVVYFYTKALALWVAHLADVGDGHTPGRLPNVVPTASFGGTEDDLVDRHGLRSARVVFSEGEAEGLNLPVDHDDSHAMAHGPDFALLLHGTQPTGTEAALAVRALRDAGFRGYGRGRVPLPVL